MNDVNKIDCVYLDMDGVLANLSASAFRLWGVPAEVEVEVDGWDCLPKIVSKHVRFEVTPKMFWSTVNHEGHEFFRDIWPYQWAQKLYETCDEYVPVVLMTTAITPQSAMGKMQWMEKWFPDAKRHAITPCKHHFARPSAMLIDDAPHNIEAFEKHGGQVFQWPMPWNTHGGGALNPEVAESAIAKLRALLEERCGVN